MILPIQFPSLATGSVVMTFMQIYPIERLNLASMSQMSCTCFKTTAEISRKKEGYPVTSESINSTSCSSKVRNFSRKQPRKAKCKPRRMGRILGLNIGLELLNQQTCQSANMGICLLQILPIELQTDEPISICFPWDLLHGGLTPILFVFCALTRHSLVVMQHSAANNCTGNPRQTIGIIGTRQNDDSGCYLISSKHQINIC